MNTRERQPSDEGLREISAIRAWLLRIWGPANSWDNPLTGTRYDPVVRRHREEQQRAERTARRAARRRTHQERQFAAAHHGDDHYTPDVA
jgi:hypothetical protein